MLRLTIAFILVQIGVNAQQEKQALWLSAEVKRELFKDFTVSTELNSRFTEIMGLETRFAEISGAYKLTKWFKPSIAYRIIGNKNKYGNVTASNRINVNLDFSHNLTKRLELGFRVRYQHAIYSSSASTSGSSTEFEKSFRFKPELTYQIKKSRFKPSISGEWFYSLSPSARQYTVTRYRLYAGTSIDLKGANELSVNFIYGKPLTGSRAQEWILSLGYTFTWKNKKEKKAPTTPSKHLDVD